VLRKARCEHSAISVGGGIAVDKSKHANVVLPRFHINVSHVRFAQDETSKEAGRREAVYGSC